LKSLNKPSVPGVPQNCGEHPEVHGARARGPYSDLDRGLQFIPRRRWNHTFKT